MTWVRTIGWKQPMKIETGAGMTRWTIRRIGMTEYRCDDCFEPATHIAESAFILPEYYCDECLWYPKRQQYKLTRLDEHPDTRKGYMALLPDGDFTEDDLWEAIAEANGLDVSEIADGDLVEWL